MDNVTSKYVIDFKDVTSVYDMFEIISTEMDFPDYFGNNWDAFWDCMTDIICTNIEIEVLNLNALDSNLQKDKEKLLCLFEELKHLDNDEWYEADINYTSGKRNKQRILYSNDGLIFVTYDHYRRFYEIV